VGDGTAAAYHRQSRAQARSWAPDMVRPKFVWPRTSAEFPSRRPSFIPEAIAKGLCTPTRHDLPVKATSTRALTRLSILSNIPLVSEGVQGMLRTSRCFAQTCCKLGGPDAIFAVSRYPYLQHFTDILVSDLSLAPNFFVASRTHTSHVSLLVAPRLSRKRSSTGKSGPRSMAQNPRGEPDGEIGRHHQLIRERASRR